MSVGLSQPNIAFRLLFGKLKAFQYLLTLKSGCISSVGAWRMVHGVVHGMVHGVVHGMVHGVVHGWLVGGDGGVACLYYLDW